MPESDTTSVIPAQLSFLTVYNPLLGPTDETIQDQVVFYTSRPDRLRQRVVPTAEDDTKEPSDEWNQRLRQIGLAQGMVSFARNFSQGQAVDYIETEKSQIVLHELEKDWWILSSVGLTRLPTEPSKQNASDTPHYLYSSREMTPPEVLIQQLRRAHAIFLLHHDFTLDALLQRIGRSAFCTLLDNFWSRFAWNWEVLLSGNPAVDMYNGIKLSAGGELGIGVGEEEWGSGEREVLEDFVTRTDGLVDLVVSRFGEPYTAGEDTSADLQEQPNGNQWLGLDAYPRPSDGVIFSGVGAISRPSVVHISQWMEWIYRYGVDAYGVSEDPTSPRRRQRRRRQRGRPGKDATPPVEPSDGTEAVSPDRGFSPGIPRPLVVGVPASSQPPPGSDGQGSSYKSSESSPARSERGNDWMGFKTDTFVKYLTLGYGSSWGASSESPSPHPRVEALKQEDRPTGESKQTGPSEAIAHEIETEASTPKVASSPKKHGKFLIGLVDDISNPNRQSLEEPTGDNNSAGGRKDVISKRIVYLRLSDWEQDATDTIQLRAVVYVHQPFIYTFLFKPDTPSLADPSLYHSIHHQLGPLHTPLGNSTSPATAAARITISEKTLDINQRFPSKNQPVYDLVYDPSNLTIRSSIPNIPDLGVYPLETVGARDPSSSSWTRVESLNIHHRLIGTYVETRSRPLELERTSKTSRGWWIVWVRMSDETTEDPPQSNLSLSSTVNDDDLRQEAFLIRKASDHIPPASHGRNSSGTQFFRDLGGAGLSSSRTDTGPGKLVEGLGLDARRYIENLLSLNR
ncbi:hypothetical protein FE257_005347 [Aspergillus nanangensis]|uniref:CCZ1/INTU/HSP4 first Longin domain-containing protein n=1 Tax=Aspergillus nanangensis TaxID=2582783 RepID=A0AAD4CA88_ASPNN|nr:hypothetical protein FE257_005347 [Aspergillus nanangensis]